MTMKLLLLFYFLVFFAFHSQAFSSTQQQSTEQLSTTSTTTSSTTRHHRQQEQSSSLQEQYEDLLASIESPLTRSHIHRTTALLHSGRCEHIYLDVGTNIGIQIRKLYQPEHYPQAEVKPIFEKYFPMPSVGSTTVATVSSTDMTTSVPLTDRRNVCAFGFEPNPGHTPRLRELEEKYQLAGFPLIIFTETAVSVDGKNLTFFTEPKGYGPFHEWGASTVRWHNDMVEVTVGSLPLAEFINLLLLSSRNKGRNPVSSKFIMKMDIEGAEYTVLPDLLLHHALCNFQLIMCEFHERFVTDHPEGTTDAFVKTINYLLRKEVNCSAQITTQDDESYGVGADSVPWPQPLKNNGLIGDMTTNGRHGKGIRYLRGNGDAVVSEQQTLTLFKGKSDISMNKEEEAVADGDNNPLNLLTYPYPKGDAKQRVLQEFSQWRDREMQ